MALGWVLQVLGEGRWGCRCGGLWGSFGGLGGVLGGVLVGSWGSGGGTEPWTARERLNNLSIALV